MEVQYASCLYCNAKYTTSNEKDRFEIHYGCHVPLPLDPDRSGVLGEPVTWTVLTVGGAVVWLQHGWKKQVAATSKQWAEWSDLTSGLGMMNWLPSPTRVSQPPEPHDTAAKPPSPTPNLHRLPSSILCRHRRMDSNVVLTGASVVETSANVRAGSEPRGKTKKIGRGWGEEVHIWSTFDGGLQAWSIKPVVNVENVSDTCEFS